jgi:hypothetical protein
MAITFFIRGLLLFAVDLEFAYRVTPAMATLNGETGQPNFIKRLAPAVQGEIGAAEG